MAVPTETPRLAGADISHAGFVTRLQQACEAHGSDVQTVARDACPGQRARYFVTTEVVTGLGRVRPTTYRLSLGSDLRFPSSARRFAGLHPEAARRTDAGAAKPSQTLYQRRRLTRPQTSVFITYSGRSPDNPAAACA
jgi:hypothetical protein